MMEKVILGEFKARYGEQQAIAALALIVQDEMIGKKRMIHDATRRVGVNYKMRCRTKYVPRVLEIGTRDDRS